MGRLLKRPSAAVKVLVRGGAQKRQAQSSVHRPTTRWRADMALVEELRKVRDAPVDSVGCDCLADRKAPKAVFEWQCLTAAMLSSQTRDQATAAAMSSLRVHGNNITSIAQTSELKLQKLIAPVGFHRTKAKNLRAAAGICLNEHRGRVPSTLEGLLALPGVGPKMAHLTLHSAFGAQEGLCIDTHIHRIANRLRWVKTTTPEGTRKALEAWLPREYWPSFNMLFVGLGQQQQQEPRKLVARCLESSAPIAALQLVKRIGLRLARQDVRPLLEEAAAEDPELQRRLPRLLAAEPEQEAS